MGIAEYKRILLDDIVEYGLDAHTTDAVGIFERAAIVARARRLGMADEAAGVVAWVEQHRETVRSVVLGSSADYLMPVLAEDPNMLEDDLIDLDMILCAYDGCGLDKTDLVDTACRAVWVRPEVCRPLKSMAAQFVTWNGVSLGAGPVYAAIAGLP